MRKIVYEQLKPEFFNYATYEDLPHIQKIIAEVKVKGDNALKKYTWKFDRVQVREFKIEKDDIKRSFSSVSKELIYSMERVAESLRKFSKRQLKEFKDFEYEVEPGIFVGQRVVPLRRVGVYVPGGRYPLISSLIMAIIPAKIAGVNEIVVCSPPNKEGSIRHEILAAADVCEVDEIYCVGGVQAIAAMAYGTQSIKKVDKIVGPGNRYVNAAKKLVYGQVGIDFIAGPTELLIIADKEANSSFIAADLIAQAEHDQNAKPMLVTDSNELADSVMKEIIKQLRGLKTAAVAKQSLEQNGIFLVVKSLEEAVEFANQRSPEHLQLDIKNPDSYIPKLKNYGSIFIGKYSSEVLGDYSCGLNHILPTNYASRYTGGLSVKDFIKILALLKVDKNSIQEIGLTAQCIAQAEGLEGHVNSVALRMRNIT